MKVGVERTFLNALCNIANFSVRQINAVHEREVSDSSFEANFAFAGGAVRPLVHLLVRSSSRISPLIRNRWIFIPDCRFCVSLVLEEHKA